MSIGIRDVIRTVGMSTITTFDDLGEPVNATPCRVVVGIVDAFVEIVGNDRRAAHACRARPTGQVSHRRH